MTKDKGNQVSAKAVNLGRIEFKMTDKDGKQKPYAWGAVVVPAEESPNGEAIWQNFKAFHKPAEDLKNLKPGDKLIVSGTEVEKSFTNSKNEQETVMELTIAKVEIVKTLEAAAA